MTKQTRLFLLGLLALSLAGCGANQEILKSGKDSPTPVSVESARNTIDRDLQDLMGWRTSTGPGRLGHIYTDDAHLSGPLAHRLQLEGPGRAGAFVKGMNTAN